MVEQVRPNTDFLPLRLVLEVSSFAAEVLQEKSECKKRLEGSEVFGRRFPRELVLSACTYFAI